MTSTETLVLQYVATDDGASETLVVAKVALGGAREEEKHRAFGVIQGLVFARKLNRTVSGEGSGRSYWLHLTDKGRAALKEKP